MTQDGTSRSVTIEARLQVFPCRIHKAATLQVQAASRAQTRASCGVRNRRHHSVHSKAQNPTVTKQILLLVAVLFSKFSSAQTQPVNATIDAWKAGASISKYIYRQFLEHIGGSSTTAYGLKCWTTGSSTIRSPRTRLPNQPGRPGGESATGDRCE